MKSFAPYDIIEIQARVAEPTPPLSLQGLLVQISGKISSDRDLNLVAQNLQEPILFEDVQFGTFILDRRFDLFETKTTWCDRPVDLSFSIDNENPDPHTALATARVLWEQQADWNRKIGDCAVAHLLNIKNDSWLESDEEAITPEQFKSKLKIQSIEVTPHGSFDFWFDDGDLFWGHAILVEGNLENGPTEACFHG